MIRDSLETPAKSSSEATPILHRDRAPSVLSKRLQGVVTPHQPEVSLSLQSRAPPLAAPPAALHPLSEEEKGYANLTKPLSVASSSAETLISAGMVNFKHVPLARTSTLSQSQEPEGLDKEVESTNINGRQEPEKSDLAMGRAAPNNALTGGGVASPTEQHTPRIPFGLAKSGGSGVDFFEGRARDANSKPCG